MKRIMVTGGAGFIGSNFVRHVITHRPDLFVLNLDVLAYAGNPENVAGLPEDRHLLVEGDIVDGATMRALLREHEIDAIVHFAAESHVDRSIHGPAAFVRTNINGTFELLEAVRARRDEDGVTVRFHHVSTDEVFGDIEPERAPCREEDPYRPSSPYSASKAASDHLVRAYHHTYGLPVTVSNCTNNYGPYQYPEKLVPLVILSALEGKPLPVYGDGKQVRDWLYVEDHCEAILAVLERGAVGGTYNVAGGNQPTNLDVIHTICGHLDRKRPRSSGAYADLICFVEDRPGHDRRYALDYSLIESELGWAPRHDLSTGIEATIDWYVEQAEWLRNIRQRPDFSAWLEANYNRRKSG